MQTQYKLLYRYVNEVTNTVITNEAEYDETKEFYTGSHKLYATEEYLNGLEETPNMEFKYKIDGVSVDEESAKLIKEENKRKEEMITQNIEDSKKSNNLYVYNGVKKEYHSKFVPEQLGYLVRDWKKIPKAQFPDGPGDYSKHFVMLNGANPGVDGAVLVCKPQYVESYYVNYTPDAIDQIEAQNNSAHPQHINPDCFINLSTIDKAGRGYVGNIKMYMNDTYMDYSQIKDIIDKNCMFEWLGLDGSNEAHYGENIITGKSLIGTETTGLGREVLVYSHKYFYQASGGKATKWTKNYKYLFFDNPEYPKIPDVNEIDMVTFTNDESYQSVTNHTTYTGFLLNNPNPNNDSDNHNLNDRGIFNYGYSFVIDKSNIIRYLIPEHYEETGKTPYIIKDQYKKIQLSPWMFHSVHNSLEDGLEAAKTLIKMIGIDNVKLVKNVPIGQFVQIK